MGEFAILADKILTGELPKITIGAILGLAALGIFLLVYKGRIRLEWIGSAVILTGQGVRRAYRWWNCKYRGQHHYRPFGSLVNPSGPIHTVRVCTVCQHRDTR